ncbi:MAG: MgtC/SapB family protein [Halobacteriota archaeon]
MQPVQAADALPVDPGVAVGVGVAFGIGALIGLEREQSESAGHVAGVRTLPLIALLGALTQAFAPSMVVASYVVVAVLALLGYAAKAFVVEDPGATTSVAMLLTYIFGAMAVQGGEPMIWAVVLGTLTAAVLSFKDPAHGFVRGIETEELRDTMKFLIVALVVLPLLPDEEVVVYGDLGLNPRFVWLMVVFVSGISLGAYVLTKYLGARKGIALSGLLGGMASSTATTIAMAARSRDESTLTSAYVFAVAVASMAMFPRVFIETAVVNPALATPVALPLGVMLAVGIALSAFVYFDGRPEKFTEVELDNPFRLRPALVFGGVFAVVLLVTSEAASAFGEGGVYATALFSGLADADAITISLARLASEGTVSDSTAVTGIVLGSAANTMTKAGIALVIGSRALALRVGLILVTTSVAGVAVAWLVV